MKNQIAIALLILITTGCMQGIPEATETADGGNKKACNTAVYQSTIAVQYSAGVLPSKISASVNGMPVVNECTLGTDNSSYLTVRAGNSLTILLRVDGNAAMNEMFFNADGTPKTNVPLQFSMKGREDCNETPNQVLTINKNLDWKPVYSNNNKACAATGYTATVSN